MTIFSKIQFLLSHPLNQHQKLKALVRFIKWQINTMLNPYPIIYPFTENAKLIIKKGMTGATGNLYCGLHEYNDMAFLIHLLRKEDCFADIGANIGSYTILASAHVGAKTFSFEPIPSTFSQLVQNIYINQIQEKVTAYNIALGSSKGSVGFNTNSYNVLNHVAMENEQINIKVPVELLDDILINKDIPLLLKIDVEGFETEVIKGALQTLQQKQLKAIIIELNGSGSRYGYKEQDIHNTLSDLNFKPFNYNPKKRVLTSVESFSTYNTIYIRDLDFVLQRLKTAPTIRIMNNEF